MNKAKELLWVDDYTTEDLEMLISELHGADYLTARNTDYCYESCLSIGPPHRLKIKMYKNE